MRPTSLAFAAVASLCLLLPVAACSCEEDPPAGDPYTCGTDAGATLCRVGQACIESMGGRTGFSCARDRGCPVDSKAIYCPTASGSVFCNENQMFPLVAPPDGGPAVALQSKVICQY